MGNRSVGVFFSDKTERNGFLAVEALLVFGKGWETGAVEVEISDKIEKDVFLL